MLEWETAAESNNKGFEIQRSGDGSHWKILGFVNGQNTSVQEHYYEFLDKNPDNGFNYYRLRQVDNNGKFQYSIIRAAEFEMPVNPSNIQLFPNPVSTNRLTLQMLDTAPCEHLITITDVSGVQWLSQTGFSNRDILDIKNLPMGLYFLKVEMDDRSFTKKVVVLK